MSDKYFKWLVYPGFVVIVFFFVNRELGASQTTIESETRKLDELKGIIFNDFRREVLSRIKKQSEKVRH